MRKESKKLLQVTQTRNQCIRFAWNSQTLQFLICVISWCHFLSDEYSTPVEEKSICSMDCSILCKLRVNEFIKLPYVFRGETWSKIQHNSFHKHHITAVQTFSNPEICSILTKTVFKMSKERENLTQNKNRLTTSSNTSSQLLAFHFIFFLFSLPVPFPVHVIKPGFHMIVGDRSRSPGSLVNCSAIVTIIWKPNFHFASDRQRSQRLPTIAGIESESISAIVAIVNDRRRSQKVNGNHQCSDCSDRNDRNDPSDHMETIAQRSQRSWRSQRSYVSCDLNDPSDYMEIKLQHLWRSQRSDVFSDSNDPSDRNDRHAAIIWKLGFKPSKRDCNYCAEIGIQAV